MTTIMTPVSIYKRFPTPLEAEDEVMLDDAVADENGEEVLVEEGVVLVEDVVVVGGIVVGFGPITST